MHSHLEIRQLECFVAVAEELHFRRAGERLGISQSALSDRISALEQNLGVSLLFRTTRQVSLTQAGAVFLKDAKEFLATIDTAVSKVRHVSDSELRSLRVSGVDEAISMLLPDTFSMFRMECPDVHIHVLEISSSDRHAKELANHHTDVAFIRSDPEDDFIECELLYRQPLAVVMAETNPLATRRVLGPEDIKGEAIVGFPRHARPILHDALWSEFRKSEDRPDVVCEVIDKSTLLRFVAQGLGVALVPAWVEAISPGGLSFVPFLPSEKFIELYVAYRKNGNSSTVMTFVEASRRAAKSFQKNSRFLSVSEPPS
jgi:DNA-binding transcriptional LysR family regulator